MSRRHLTIPLKIIVSAGLLYLVYRKVAPDWSRVGGEIGAAFRQGYGWLIGALMAVGIVFTISPLRWKTILHAHGVDLPFFRMLRLSLVGFFFGQFMPGGLAAGDVVRSYYLSCCTTDKKTECVATVVVDRVIGSAGFLTVVVVSLLLWGGHLQLALTVLGGGVVLAMGIALFFSRRVLKSLPYATWIGDHLPYRDWLERVYEAFRHYRHHRVRLLACWGISLGVQLLLVLAAYCVGQSVGVRATPLEYLIRVPLVGAISTIPISVGSIGLAEFGYAYFFLETGAPEAYRSVVGAFALMMRFLWLFIGAIGGVIWLAEKGKLSGNMARGSEACPVPHSAEEAQVYKSRT
jgi:uncharacterized protein (TIRG00374 family)